MSESNSIDKISETITNIFKKTEIFEKMGRIQNYISSFIVLSSVIGLTSIYINYYNLNKIKILEEKLKESGKNIKYNIQLNQKQIEIGYNKLIKNIKNHVLISDDNTLKILNKIQELNVMIQKSKPEGISASTSISSSSPLKLIIPTDNNNDWINQNDDWINHIIDKKDDNNDHDDELINECYDSIPLNNLKKNTGLNWFFK